MADPIPIEITLGVRNHSTIVQRSELKVAFTAFLKQANNDLHLYWTADRPDPDDPYVPYVREITEVPDGTQWHDSADVWRATIYDYPYQAEYDEDLEHMPIEGLRSIGYHWFDGVIPHMVVFAAASQQAGLPWTLTFSHELLETLADPRATSVLGTADYEVEICDPVQYDAYEIDGVVVSNFVTPAWFNDSHKGVVSAAASSPTDSYDYAGQLSSAGGRTPGGVRARRTKGGQDHIQA